MKCNNAIASYIEGRYRITMPSDKQAEKDEILKEAIEKYNGYCHIEISKVHKPKSVEANALFHSLLTVYYSSGCHSCDTWDGLKISLKLRYGAGMIHQEEIDGEKIGFLKSMSGYTTAELSGCIDGTIKEMLLTGVSGEKFDEILEGINYEG